MSWADDDIDDELPPLPEKIYYQEPAPKVEEVRTVVSHSTVTTVRVVRDTRVSVVAAQEKVVETKQLMIPGSSERFKELLKITSFSTFQRDKIPKKEDTRKSGLTHGEKRGQTSKVCCICEIDPGKYEADMDHEKESFGQVKVGFYCRPCLLKIVPRCSKCQIGPKMILPPGSSYSFSLFCSDCIQKHKSGSS